VSYMRSDSDANNNAFADPNSYSNNLSVPPAVLMIECEGT